MRNRALVLRRASDARAEIGLSLMEPVPDLGRLLRAMKSTTVIRRPFVGDVSGCFTRSGDWAVIVVNSLRSLGHQNFTVAHEYYHARFDTGLEGCMCIAEGGHKRPEGEKEADEFAAEFLMPESAVKYQLSQLTGFARPLEMDDAIELEQCFGVSHTAMLTRLVALGLLSEKARQQFASLRVTREARRLGYDPALYLPTQDEVIMSPIARMASEALRRGCIGQGKYSEILRESRLLNILYGGEEEPVDAAGEPRNATHCG